MKGRGFQRLKWGFIFAGLYLLVSVPCAVVYQMHRHEYTIPMLIVSHASLPVQFMMADVLRSFTVHIERWPHGELWFLSILLGMTTIFYFFLGQSLGWVVRTTASFFSHPRERVDI